MSAWDIVVVGAGPAGSVLSRELARRGRSVLLVERETLPRWKVCGACLGPAARSVLEEVGLGLLPRSLGAVPLERMVLAAGGRRAGVALAGSEALSRATLDAALASEAERAGVTLRTGCRARTAERCGDELRVTFGRSGVEDEVRARVVVDAGGLGGGLSDPSAFRVRLDARVGLGAVFPANASSVAAGELHMVVGPAGYVGLVRQEDDTLNVAAAVDPSALRGSSPEAVVEAILEGGGGPSLVGPPVLGWRGTPALTRTAARMGGWRMFRLGDASGYVEPFTGEGMGWAFGGAVALAGLADRAVEQWDPGILTAWEEHRGRVRARSTLLCRVLARGLRRPRLVHLGVDLLGRAPGLARPFVRAAARPPRRRSVSGGWV